VSSTLDFQMWALANYNVNYGSLFGSLVAATLSNVGEAFEEVIRASNGEVNLKQGFDVRVILSRNLRVCIQG
jgi:hypothetical protein